MDEPLKDRARRLREARGLTQAQLAELAGVSPTHVYQIERGLRKRMHVDTLARYARALEVSPQYLDVGYEPAPVTPQQWPDVAATLRHTTPLEESSIQQVVRFVQALISEQELQKLKERTGGEGDVSLHIDVDSRTLYR